MSKNFSLAPSALAHTSFHFVLRGAPKSCIRESVTLTHFQTVQGSALCQSRNLEKALLVESPQCGSWFSRAPLALTNVPRSCVLRGARKPCVRESVVLARFQTITCRTLSCKPQWEKALIVQFALNTAKFSRSRHGRSQILLFTFAARCSTNHVRKRALL